MPIKVPPGLGIYAMALTDASNSIKRIKRDVSPEIFAAMFAGLAAELAVSCSADEWKGILYARAGAPANDHDDVLQTKFYQALDDLRTSVLRAKAQNTPPADPAATDHGHRSPPVPADGPALPGGEPLPR